MKLTFTVYKKQQLQVLMIGGMQGTRDDISDNAMRNATKSSYGLFPKRLLLEAVQLFTKVTGIAQIEAVSNNSHIVRRRLLRRNKNNVFLANYDEFWTSINAQVILDGLYSLPMTIPRKPIEKVASKKRSEYRNRYKLLDAMQESFHQKLD